MPIKVLVIDDDPDTRDILRYILQDDGYEVITNAGDPGDNQLKLTSPDIMIVDDWLAGEVNLAVQFVNG
jgi:two-component system, NtrC family, nitrogen regulation response regulator NtrX